MRRPAPENTTDLAQQRYFRASFFGAIPAVLIFLRILWNNGGIFAGSLFSGFYEVQARAFRHANWEIPPGSLGIEAFVIDGKSYEYYGPFPAILRMPLMWLFPGMDGRWTQPFMFLALLLALGAATRLGWQVRQLVQGPEVAVTKTECWWVGMFTFGLGAGSVLLFLGSHAWVYHEAEIWGASLSLCAFAALCEYLTLQKSNRLIWACAFATMAINSRASVGFGPIVATLGIGAASLFAFSREWFGIPAAFANWRRRFGLAVAASIPIFSYMYVNFAKFGSLFVFPSDKQIFSGIGVYRREMLAQNNNSLFGFKFFATAARQYLRPDALSFRSLVPFVDFPRTASVLGDSVLFDTIEPTSSVPSSMPVLFVLSIIGLVVLVRGKQLLPVRGIAIGALAGAWTVVPYSYIGQRYMSDFVAPLVVLGSVGLATGVRFANRSQARRRWSTATLASGVGFAVFVNSALAWSYHFETELQPEGAVTSFVEQQYYWHETFPGGDPPYVKTGAALPYPPLKRGTTFVVGDCEAVYWSQGNTWPQSSKWYALARSEASGQYDLRLRFAFDDTVKVHPVVVRGEAGSIQAIAVQVRKQTIRFGFYSEPNREFHAGRETGRDKLGYLWGRPLRYDPEETYAVQVVMDPNNGKISVVLDGYPGFVFFDYGLTTPQLAHYVVPAAKVSIGENTVGAPMSKKFNGALRIRTQNRPGICDSLLPE